MRYQKDSLPYTESELRASLPNVSLPETLLPEHVAEFGFVPYVEPPPPVPTPEEVAARLQADVVARTQQRLDDFARTRGYDNVDSMSKYKDITDAEIATLPSDEQALVNKFRAECRHLALVTAQSWARLYLILGEVQAGMRSMPASYEEIEPELPVLTWPV